MQTLEAEARAHLRRVRNPEREGWVCLDCDPNDLLLCEDVKWVWFDDDATGDPLCQWHADERVHDSIAYGTNCSECGVEHSALWKD